MSARERVQCDRCQAIGPVYGTFPHKPRCPVARWEAGTECPECNVRAPTGHPDNGASPPGFCCVTCGCQWEGAGEEENYSAVHGDPPCDKCGEPNPRHEESNYCEPCADTFKARLRADPETRPGRDWRKA
jgi:hypothetical protein